MCFGCADIQAESGLWARVAHQSVLAQTANELSKRLPDATVPQVFVNGTHFGVSGSRQLRPTRLAVSVHGRTHI